MKGTESDLVFEQHSAEDTPHKVMILHIYRRLKNDEPPTANKEKNL